MRVASENSWTPLGVAARQVVEGVVVRNPYLAPIWIKHDRTAVERAQKEMSRGQR